MGNRPLYIPAGVRLRRSEDANDTPVLVCEGPCRPSWTMHRRIGGGEMIKRYVCEACQTSRRWGT
jgi:hypothetical protein